MVDVQAIKNSLRVENDADDQLIAQLIATASDYVQNAVDASEDLTEYAQFDFAVILLTEFWYQSRGEVTDSPSEPPFSVTSMIQQLRGIVALKQA